jgi:hypothetical protein
MPYFQHKKSAHSKTHDMAQSMAIIIEKATGYHKTASDKAHCHFVMSENAGRENLSMGLLTTIFSTIVGTTIFANLADKDKTPIHWLQIATGFLSVAAAVLAALQTFFKFSDVSAHNKTAAIGYEKVKLSIDIFLLTYDPGSTQTDQAIAELKAITLDLEKIDDSSPSIPDSVYNKVINKAKKSQ